MIFKSRAFARWKPGLMVYFGWPEAREDDAERAVRVALMIVDEVAALNGRLAPEQRVQLSVRVGIHSGAVVISQGNGSEADVYRNSPNVAVEMTKSLYALNEFRVEFYLDCHAVARAAAARSHAMRNHRRLSGERPAGPSGPSRHQGDPSWEPTTRRPEAQVRPVRFSREFALPQRHRLATRTPRLG